MKTLSENISCNPFSQLCQISQCSQTRNAGPLQGESEKKAREAGQEETRSNNTGVYRQALAVAGMSMGCLLDGTVIAYSSPALPSLLSESSHVQINVHHSSWIGSMHTLGAVVGCLLSIPTMSRLGRRGAALYVMSVSYLLGYILIGTAAVVEQIIVGRFFGGLGLGLTLSITPVYLVECVNVKSRGMLGVIPPLLTQVGLLLTYLSGIWLDWSELALSGIGLVIPTILFIWAIPESPHYLAVKGNFRETEASLLRLGREESSSSYYKEVQSQIQVQSDNTGTDGATESQGCLTNLKSKYRYFTQPKIWRPTLVCLLLMFFFQATGYNTVIAYAKLIFKESGLDMDEHLATGITGTVILASTACAVGLSRVLPRKVLLLISSIGTCSMTTSMGIYYYLTRFGTVENFTWIPLATMIFFIIFFMVGYGAVAWTVMAEVLPPAVRGQVYPFAVAFSWVCNFGFAHSFSYILTFLGAFGAFWTYAILSFTGAIVIYFIFPETKDRTPEQIAEHFCANESASLTVSLPTEVHIP